MRQKELKRALERNNNRLKNENGQKERNTNQKIKQRKNLMKFSAQLYTVGTSFVTTSSVT